MSDAQSIKSPSDSQLSKEKAIGTDVLALMIYQGAIRTGLLKNEYVGSIIDVVTRFVGSHTRNPSKWWNENKARIVGNSKELSESVGQLKLEAKDGKMRSTDVAPLWVLIWIIARMDTPEANAFTAQYLKVHANDDAAIIRHRFANIMKGSEWAADSIHQKLLEAGLTHPDPDDPIWKDDAWKR